MDLIFKAMLGAAVVVILAMLAKTKNYYIAGLVPLFPTFALIAHYIVGKGRSIDDLKTTIVFGMWSIIPYFVYLATLYGLSPMISLKYGQYWPAHRIGPGNVVITCVAGYAADAAPEPVKQAILLAFGDFNVSREQQTQGVISDVAAVAIDNLLINHRRAYA